MKKIVILFLTALMFSSCATIFRKDFTQEITFDPNEPKQAFLYVNGEYKGVTPVTLKLDSREEYDIKYTKRSAPRWFVLLIDIHIVTISFLTSLIIRNNFSYDFN